MYTFSRFCLSFIALLPALPLLAQISFPKPAPSDEREGLRAFTNATIYLDYKTKLEKATLLIRNGKIEACGANVTVPAGAIQTDCSGKTIYPAFIDVFAGGYGLPAAGATPAAQPFAQRRSQPNTGKKGAYAWNEALRPEFNAAEAFVAPVEVESSGPGAGPGGGGSAGGGNSAQEWRKQGFGAVLTHRADGISRGTGALALLAEGREHELLLLPQAGHFLSLRKGSSTQDYPSSLMGVICLLRQTYLDGQWYKTEGRQVEQNLSLEAWNAAQSLPQFFEASDKLDVLRIARIGQEFGVKYCVKTNGDEYQRLDDIKACGLPLVLPLNFPEAFDVRDPYEAMNVSLRELKHWELAPSNPARVEAAGLTFALTTSGMKDKGKFWDNLRKAIEYGLTEEGALKALTAQPAALMNASGMIGSLEKGKVANFVVANGNIFKSDTKILQTWVKGLPYEVSPEKKLEGLPGLWKLEISGGENPGAYTMTLKGKPESPEVQLLRPDSMRLKANLSVQTGGLVTLSFAPDTTKKEQIALSGAIGDKIWAGRGTLANGAWVDWKATYTGPAEAGKERGGRKPAEASKPALGDLIYPFTAFGWKDKPRAQTVLVQNATVWTNEKDGVLQNTDVLISNGKIVKIGKKLPVQDNAVVVDGSGKHLTAGIIDEHSHIAVTRSVNEGSQESSAEVRIGDVLDSEDTDIYRQLAGGVTSSHLLHGSANPIGGQTQLIKLRWGYAPEALKFDNWPGFIKFALGENVKRSNSTDQSRYPQTRMGVEQVFVDYFTRAKEYSALKKSGKPYRKDLELEALAEILDSKRFITCHSYVQSEITMMLRVADRFGFKLNTFTHILEGYKVSDKMAKHGAGGSTFSDWWAYKYEVHEAIPQNAKMMHDRGVVVAINSDDAEMARRLNQEAAKSMLYGGMKEEDAWKMVTLNPAKLLHIEDRVGSIKTGKDADLVLWNDNPLSIYARPEKTWVDGILFFDRAEDARRSEWVRGERARLIQKMQAEKKSDEGGPGSGRRPAAPKHYYECESADDEG